MTTFVSRILLIVSMGLLASAVQAQEAMNQMMGARQQMKADMHSAEAKLDALVAKMKAADGQEKLDAMAEVVTELAVQRKKMMSEMMGMKDANECPMMKGMMKEKEK